MAYNYVLAKTRKEFAARWQDLTELQRFGDVADELKCKPLLDRTCWK